MGLDRRVIVALSVIALILAPAAVLRAVCAGHSCDEPDDGAANVPFCSLPETQRAEIVAGFREGRSPDVLVVRDEEPAEGVPLVLAGTGISGAAVPDRPRLDSIAPTIAEVVGLRRPHPEVRSGTALPGIASGERPGVVVLIAVKGLGSEDLHGRAWTRLRALGQRGTMAVDARVGSRPNDPAAVLATIGTGGLPRQHGITGELHRDGSGNLVRAWGPRAPVSIIATLADDLDEEERQEPMIGLVGTSRSDRGLIGGDWYVDNDRDHVVTDPAADPVERVTDMLQKGFGEDRVADLIAVALSGPPRATDRAIGEIADLAEDVPAGAAIVVTGTGPIPKDNARIVSKIERSLGGDTKFIEGPVPGGFFVDQRSLARTGTTEDEVIDAVKDTGAFTDAFAAITVAFARYC